MARLEHRMLVAHVGRGREPHAADQSGPEVRQDVPEQVFHRQHVEIPRAANQVERHRVHVMVACFDVRMLRRLLVEHLAHERERADCPGSAPPLPHLN